MGALLIIMGSVLTLFSCKENNPPPPNPETLMTQQSDSLTIVVTKNGLKQYRFITPLMERYELAREPYMEFRQGIYVETFKDTTEVIESTIVADYAIRYENRSLWETRGNVVATGDDRTLYTEQLFWDEKTQRVYSNVDSKVVQGDDVFIGEGFESDDKFKNWTFRNYTGQLAIDAPSNEKPDSASADAPQNADKEMNPIDGGADGQTNGNNGTGARDNIQSGNGQSGNGENGGRNIPADGKSPVPAGDTTSGVKPNPARIRPEAAPEPAARPTQLRQHNPVLPEENKPAPAQQSDSR